jgi:hypothetical protein
MTALEQEFVKDHKEMTRALVAVLTALENQDDSLAIQLADQLDVLAGPHIRFEESILYPTVAKSAGKELHQRLLAEHQQPLAAIRFLLKCRDDASLSAAERQQMIEQFRTGLVHVESCGRLLSHLTSLDEQTQSRYLQELRDLRSAKTRWSELERSSDSHEPSTT